MAQRTQSNDYLDVFSRPSLAPAANPVDTFVRPSLASSKGEQLAAAVASLDALQPALKREFKREADEDLAEGEQLFEEKRTDFAEAVRSGEIPAGASPYVRRGYRISQLRTLSASYAVELNRAMESSNIHEVDDPAQVEAFIRDFTDQFEETNGVEGMDAREVDRHYRPHTVQAQNAFRREQANRNIELLEERRVRQFEQELLAGLRNGRGDISGWISHAAQEMYEEGIDHSEIERVIMGTVGTYAMTTGSVAMVNMLNRVEVAGMGPLGASARGQDMITRVRERVAVKAQSQAAAAERADRAQRKAEQVGIERQIAQAYLDGDTDTAEELARSLLDYDADAAYTWANRADSLGDENDRELSEANMATIIGVGIESGDPEYTRDVAREALRNGDITIQQYQQLDSVAEDIYPNEDDADAVPSILKSLGDDPNYKGVIRDLGTMIERPGYGGTVTSEHRDAADRAQRSLQRDAIAWMQRNRDEAGRYDELAFQDFLWSRSDAYRDRWLDPGDFEENRTIEEAIQNDQSVIKDPSVPALLPPSARSKVTP